MSTSTNSPTVIIDGVDPRILASRSSERAVGLLDRVLISGLLAVLVFGPLAFGAVQEWAIFVLESSAALLFLVWVARGCLTGRIAVAGTPIYLPLLLFAGLAAAQLVLGRSAYLHASFSEFLRIIAYGLLMFVAAQTLTSHSARRRFAETLVVFGLVVSVFAILQSLTSTGRIYWLVQPQDGRAIFGPYVNRNHYAGLMEMLLPFGFFISLKSHYSLAWRVTSGLATVLMSTSILLSQSRGGTLAFLGELLLLSFLLAAAKVSRRAALGLGALLLGFAFLLAWTGAIPSVERFFSLRHGITDEISNNRLTIALDTLRMWKEKPVLGWGLDTFGAVYPRFRTFYTDKLVNQPHNDFLQVLAETGLVGFGLILWFCLALFRRGLDKYARWQSEPGRGASLAAFVGCTGLLIHSCFDFNLHIPANAALFFVLAALATTATESSAPVAYQGVRATDPEATVVSRQGGLFS